MNEIRVQQKFFTVLWNAQILVFFWRYNKFDYMVFSLKAFTITQKANKENLKNQNIFIRILHYWHSTLLDTHSSLKCPIHYGKKVKKIFSQIISPLCFLQSIIFESSNSVIFLIELEKQKFTKVPKLATLFKKGRIFQIT